MAGVNVARASAPLPEWLSLVMSERQKHSNLQLQFRSGGNSKLCAEGNLDFLHLSVTYTVPDKAHSSVTRSSRQTIPVFIIILCHGGAAPGPPELHQMQPVRFIPSDGAVSVGPALQLKYKNSHLLSAQISPAQPPCCCCSCYPDISSPAPGLEAADCDQNCSKAPNVLPQVRPLGGLRPHQDTSSFS